MLAKFILLLLSCSFLNGSSTEQGIASSDSGRFPRASVFVPNQVLNHLIDDIVPNPIAIDRIVGRGWKLWGPARPNLAASIERIDLPNRLFSIRYGGIVSFNGGTLQKGRRKICVNSLFNITGTTQIRVKYDNSISVSPSPVHLTPVGISARGAGRVGVNVTGIVRRNLNTSGLEQSVTGTIWQLRNQVNGGMNEAQILETLFCYLPPLESWSSATSQIGAYIASPGATHLVVDDLDGIRTCVRINEDELVALIKRLLGKLRESGDVEYSALADFVLDKDEQTKKELTKSTCRIEDSLNEEDKKAGVTKKVVVAAEFLVTSASKYFDERLGQDDVCKLVVEFTFKKKENGWTYRLDSPTDGINTDVLPRKSEKTPPRGYDLPLVRDLNSKIKKFGETKLGSISVKVVDIAFDEKTKDLIFDLKFFLTD